MKIKIYKISLLIMLLFNLTIHAQNDMDKVVKLQNQESADLTKKQNAEKAEMEKNVITREASINSILDKKIQQLDKNSPDYQANKIKIEKERIAQLKAFKLNNQELRKSLNERQFNEKASMLKRHVKNTNDVKNNLNNPEFQAKKEQNLKLGALESERNKLINKNEQEKATHNAKVDQANQKLLERKQNEDVTLAKKQTKEINDIQLAQGKKIAAKKNAIDNKISKSSSQKKQSKLLTKKDKAVKENVKETSKLLTKKEKKHTKTGKELDKKQAKDKKNLSKAVITKKKAIVKKQKKDVKKLSDDQKKQTKAINSATKKKVKKTRKKK